MNLTKNKKTKRKQKQQIVNALNFNFEDYNIDNYSKPKRKKSWMIQKMIVLMKKVAMLMTSPPSKKVKQTEKNNKKV